jgi:hypothetical protein
MKTATLARLACAAFTLAHLPAALAHAGHGAPVHWHAAETMAAAVVAILAGLAACGAIAARESRRS